VPRPTHRSTLAPAAANGSRHGRGQRRQRAILAGREELDEERDGDDEIAGDAGDRDDEERGDV